MELAPWIAALSPAGLLAAVLWFARKLILTRLVKSVEHEFDSKLENVRAELRASEELLKAELRAKEAQIEALRSGAMTALASRQMALDNRRLEAVDQLWSAVTALAPARVISNMMAVINFEEAAKRAEHNPRLRGVFELFGSGLDLKSLDLSAAQISRPFVSPLAWAIYSALVAISMHAVMRCEVLKAGIGAEDFMNTDAISNLLKAALPHQTDYIDRFGPSGYNLLLAELDSKLLQEFNAMLSGASADKASLEQAAEILRLSNEVSKELDSTKYSA